MVGNQGKDASNQNGALGIDEICKSFPKANHAGAYAFDDLLVSCCQEIIENGLRSPCIPTTIRDWICGKAMEALPLPLVKSLLSSLIENRDITETMSFYERVHGQCSEFTLIMYRSEKAKIWHEKRRKKAQKRPLQPQKPPDKPTNPQPQFPHIQPQTTTKQQQLAQETINRINATNLQYGLPLLPDFNAIVPASHHLPGSAPYQNGTTGTDPAITTTSTVPTEGSTKDQKSPPKKKEPQDFEIFDAEEDTGQITTDAVGFFCDEIIAEPCTPVVGSLVKFRPFDPTRAEEIMQDLYLNIISSDSETEDEDIDMDRIGMQCVICRKVFAKQEGLQKHQIAAHGEYWKSRPVRAGVETKSRIPKTVGTKKDANNFYDDILECEVCETPFTKVWQLYQHQRRQHPEYWLKKPAKNPKSGFAAATGVPKQPTHKLRCNMCEDKFDSQVDLHEHQKNMHPDYWSEKERMATERLKANTCEVCGKTFSKRSTLTLHMYSHTGLYPFNCDECGAGFSTAYKLRRHSMKHTNEYDYYCDICEQGFRDEYKYREEHCKKHHPKEYKQWKHAKEKVARIQFEQKQEKMQEDAERRRIRRETLEIERQARHKRQRLNPKSKVLAHAPPTLLEHSLADDLSNSGNNGGVLDESHSSGNTFPYADMTQPIVVSSAAVPIPTESIQITPQIPFDVSTNSIPQNSANFYT